MHRRLRSALTSLLLRILRLTVPPASSVLAALLAAPLSSAEPPTPRQAEDLASLGKALFFDPGLSEPAGQACATCHSPQKAFSDPRANGTAGALSLGADGHSLGDRNTPALTYAASIPSFGLEDGLHRGGFFLDGRAATLEAQAIEPLLNPLEMGLTDSATLVAKVLGKPAYRTALTASFGEALLTDPELAVNSISRAIATYERSAEFATFDSRYDRYLAGEYQMTRTEAIGRELFFSDLLNCIQCHVNEPGQVSPRETFTNHRFHNIGVPTNSSARQANGIPITQTDPGLLGNPAVDDARALGRFRVPGLRNVAVTAPYMHNGVFASLEAAVAFYAKYTVNGHPGNINPETGLPWRRPEVIETVEVGILSGGQPIDSQRITQLVAFLKTLTDRRYEHLLD